MKDVTGGNGMNSKQIMQLVDTYVSACVELQSENANYGTVEAGSVRYMERARSVLIAEIEILTNAINGGLDE